MFYYIEGKITELDNGFAVLDANGIGYLINVSNYTLSSLSIGSSFRLYVKESIGETNFDLYGFLTKAERTCFEKLISVSGIGPKAAISILSCNSPDALALAVATGNENALTAASGIGKKTAQRVLLELKDKLVPEIAGNSNSFISPQPTSSASNAALEAIGALSALGYSSAEINQVLKTIDIKGLTSEQIVRVILKQMI